MDDQNCDCCEGTQILTPASVANRPGLSALRYRVGTHARFLETMKARLSNMPVEIPNPEDAAHPALSYPLSALTTRSASDPAIALLDGWATIADVLTFYQERIANEGFLGTATERRSVLELARLIGYSLRPGVSASVFLALDLDKGHQVVIQPGEIKAQSVPGPGEMPQTFENGEALDARYAWNRLKPRQHQPQTISSILDGNAAGNAQMYVKGISANLKANDVILVTEGQQPLVYAVASATPDPANDRTLVIFQEPKQAGAGASKVASKVLDAAPLVALAQDMLKSQPTLGRSKLRTEMAQRVNVHLNTLVERLQTPGISVEASMQVVHDSLAKITEERDMALGDQYARLAPWLADMVQKLDAAHQALSTQQDGAAPQAAPMAEASLNQVQNAMATGDQVLTDPLSQAMSGLTRPASIPPRNTLNLARDLGASFGASSDIGIQVGSLFNSDLSNTLPAALANIKVVPDSKLRAYVFRAVARPFGHNAQPRAAVSVGKPPTYTEWTMDDPLGTASSGGVIGLRAEAAGTATPVVDPPHHTRSLLYLDGEYKLQSNNGWVMLSGPYVPNGQLIFSMADGLLNTVPTSLAAYGMSGKSTLLDVVPEALKWTMETTLFDPVRTTLVYLESEELPLAEAPLDALICGGATEWIELDGMYSGLQSGRWLIVSGERTDIGTPNQVSVANIKSTELVMLAEVIQDVTNPDGVPFYKGMADYGKYSSGTNNKNLDQTPAPKPPALPLPGDRPHTWIRLAKKLEYCYRRDTLEIYGNVIKATHGETRKEVLGSGDASQAFQSFTLKQSPLTFTASPSPSGAESSLQVYVNDVRWAEAGSMTGLEPTDRKFVTKTDDASKTTVIFGNGQSGARLPTGPGNLRAQYRSGIGRPGNVSAGQISLLMSKPLGVQAVTNPLRSSGGADRESMDTARKNAPRTVTALDRLVSVSDYADFSRTFAGIGKSVARRATYKRRPVVQVTIAGADDIPIDESSDLYANLLCALRLYGDPDVPVILQLRFLYLLFISANLRILPDYQWESVARTVRAKLLDTFSFERRELGQDVFLSEVIAAIQSAPGVDYVDVDKLGVVPEKLPDKFLNPTHGTFDFRQLTPFQTSVIVRGQITDSNGNPRPPAQTLGLNQIGVSLARFGLLLPAPLAYLNPDVADMLVLNQVK